MPSTEVQYVLCCEIEANPSVLNGKFIHNFSALKCDFY